MSIHQLQYSPFFKLHKASLHTVPESLCMCLLFAADHKVYFLEPFHWKQLPAVEENNTVVTFTPNTQVAAWQLNYELKPSLELKAEERWSFPEGSMWHHGTLNIIELSFDTVLDSLMTKGQPYCMPHLLLQPLFCTYSKWKQTQWCQFGDAPVPPFCHSTISFVTKLALSHKRIILTFKK